MKRNRVIGVLVLVCCLTIAYVAIVPISRCCILSAWGYLGYVDKIGDSLRTDESALVRRHAASLLADLGRPSSRMSQQQLSAVTPFAADVLVRALADKDESVRMEVARALATIAHYNQVDELYLGSLIDVIDKETNDDIRVEIVRTIGSIGRDADLLVPCLVKALPQASPNLRIEIIRTLRVLKADRTQAVPFLIDAAKGPDVATSVQAIMTLQSIGADAKEAIPVLNELSRHDNEEVRSLAIFALRQVDQKREKE